VLPASRWLLLAFILVFLPRPALSDENAAYPESLRLPVVLRFLKDPRAFQRGFLRVGRAGHFVWADGTRARFWGVNIANKNLWIGHEEIDRVVTTLSRSGVNLVRFEAIDSRGGILEIGGQPGSRQLDPVKLEALHYWIYRLRQQGISYYLNLIDFRDFTEADQVPNGPALGRAAKPYAVFDPYLITLQKEYATQLLGTANPYTGLAPVDDPALVMLEICNEHGFFLNSERLERLVDPYRGTLEKMWGQWLIRRYGSRDAVARAWGRWKDLAVLESVEDPRDGTVRLPLLKPPSDAAASADDVRFAPARMRDGIEFLYQVQRAYFKTMRDHARGIGLKVPVTAVVSNDIAADLASVAAECDFLSENHYADHPRFSAKDWEGRYHYYNRNQLRDTTAGAFAPLTAALRWDNKPVVVREWGTVWPNRYRAVSVPEAVGYARLQDYDAMILFGYKTGENADRLVEFGYQADPPVWGLYALGALAFLRGDVQPSDVAALLVYTPSALFKGAGGPSDLLRLAWCVRLGTTFSLSAIVPRGGRVAATTVPPLPGRQPIVIPMDQPPTSEVVLSRVRVAGDRRPTLQNGTYTSTTGQLIRDSSAGRMLIDAPRLAAVAGELQLEPAVSAGALSVASASEIGTVMAISLDGLPLAQSKRYVVKMVTVAENTGQSLVQAAPGAAAPYVLATRGQGPVLTRGMASVNETVVSLNGSPLVSIGMANGTWECFVDGQSVYFWCDTPGMKAVVAGRPLITEAQAVQVR